MIRLFMIGLMFVGALFILNAYWPQAWTMGFHIPNFLTSKVEGPTRLTLQAFTIRYAWLVLLPVGYFAFKMKFAK